MASLYDDIDINKTSNSDENGQSKTGKSKLNLVFLKSQLDAKKAAMLQSHKLSPAPTVTKNITSIQVQAPVIVNQDKPKSLLNLKPRKALPLSSGTSSAFTIIPKSLKEDKVFLFSEILVEDEYNPTQPTDYATYKPKRELQKAKEKAAKEIAEKLQKQYDEEEAKRKTGAAFAPPLELVNESSTEATDQNNQIFEPPKQFGKAGSRGLGVAANIMQKLGYQEGYGLGRFGQGISQALKVERTGRRNQGLIINNDEREEPSAKNIKFESDSPPSETIEDGPKPNITEVLKTATKIILLRNMVHPGDFDSELETEIREEMKKYGQLINVTIHQIPNKPDDESVRIFLEFSNQAQAIKAFVGNDGRFFAGKSVRASFYPQDNYVNRMLDLDV